MSTSIAGDGKMSPLSSSVLGFVRSTFYLTKYNCQIIQLALNKVHTEQKMDKLFSPVHFINTFGPY